jgi:hypothetical protein
MSDERLSVMDAVQQAEREYARQDHAQDHLAPDSEGYVELGPIVPWIERRASELCGVSTEEIHRIWFATVQGEGR